MEVVPSAFSSWSFERENKDQLIMSKRTETSIQKIGGVDPSFLVPHIEDDDSLDSMQQYRILPRIKIVLGSSSADLKSQFGEGVALIRPGDAVVCGKGELDSFLFNPQFFYVEWCKWADLKDKDSPMILERSFDPDSDLAKCAADPERRFEVYEGQESKGDKAMKYRYVQHFRFPGAIYGTEHPLGGTSFSMSFERGEFYQGSNFISAIQLRTFVGSNGIPQRLPLWSQVWEFKVSLRERGGYNWYGFDFQPPEVPIIQPHEKDAALAAYEALKEAHAKKRLLTEEPDQDDTQANPGDEGDF